MKNTALSHLDPVDSDKFMDKSLLGSFFLTELETPTIPVSREGTDSDGFSADEFYVVLDKPLKYCPDDNLDELVNDRKALLFSELRKACRREIDDSNYVFINNSLDIEYVQLYGSDDCCKIPRVKTCIAVSRKLDVKIVVHGNEIPSDHVIWENVDRSCFTVNGVKRLLSEFANYEICRGNQDQELQELIPVGAYMREADISYKGYWEGHYIGSTIRSTKCQLIKNSCHGSRCAQCQVYRRTLIKTLARRKKVPAMTNQQTNWLKSKTANNRLTQSQKVQKIQQLKTYSQELEEEVRMLRRVLKRKINGDDVSLSFSESREMMEIMEASEDEVKQCYPDKNCYQRLFWEQHRKHTDLQDMAIDD